MYDTGYWPVQGVSRNMKAESSTVFVSVGTINICKDQHRQEDIKLQLTSVEEVIRLFWC